ncbi:MAG TPA: winged helix-turn-helix domain-containing protein [Edaphobacter sp.]|nr:winged helix-turn-helix domain-containing protein [Edaphobacter sp.]
MIGNKSFIFRFSDVEVREHEFSLLKAGKVLTVEPKAFRVLLLLLRNPQKLISKEELLNSVWGDTAVTEGSLTRCIWLLRRQLGDDINEPRFIETVATVGYRFVCKVEVSEDGSGDLQATGEANRLNEGDFVETLANGEIATNPLTQIDKPAADRKRSRSRSWLLPGNIILVVGLATAIWYLRRPLPPPRLTNPVQLTRDGRRKNVVGTDGNRLYLNILEPKAVGQVPVSGGLITEIPFDLPSQGGLWGVSSVSPDGSSLLALDHFDIFRGSARVSIIGILGHPVRYLTESNTATFSPDGRSVLYATPHGDIYSMAAGGEPRLILASHVPEGERVRTWDLSWSPGGSTIRFTRGLKIWEVSSSGSNLHQLLPGWHASASQWGGQWTLDGEFFLFVSGSIGSMNRFPNYNHGGQLWAIDERRGRLRPAIAEPIQLTSGPMVWGPAVSARDGHTIFSRGMSRRGELVRYDKRSNHFDPYLRGISAEMVAFSRDGRYVAYVTFPDGILWRANRDGTGLLQLTKPPFYPRDVRWSPDGSEIVFTDNSQNGVDAIYVVPSQGGTPKRLIPEESGPHADLTWSPDGKKVVYSTTCWQSVGNCSPAKIEVRILELATRRIITLPHRPEGFGSPRWSPDGRYIAGMPLKADNLSIFDLKTQQWKDLLRKGFNGFPSWSKDGRFIYFQRPTDDRGIFRIPISGGDEERIVDLKEFRNMGWYPFGWLGLDPTDAPLLLRDTGTDEIYALTLEQK